MDPSLPIFSGDSRSLGRSLRTWRTLRRIKQQHAAQLLAVSQATLSRWENGQAAPDVDGAMRLRSLLAARLDSAGDRVLARLVQQSAAPVHLVCDLTHRLLAASQSRALQFKVPTSQLLGASLWRCASEAIVQAESQLAAQGWFGPQPPVVEFHTGQRDSADLTILACRMRWVRLQLSDGSFVRLVESLEESAAPSQPGHAVSPASQSAIAASDTHSR